MASLCKVTAEKNSLWAAAQHSIHQAGTFLHTHRKVILVALAVLACLVAGCLLWGFYNVLTVCATALVGGIGTAVGTDLAKRVYNWCYTQTH